MDFSEVAEYIPKNNYNYCILYTVCFGSVHITAGSQNVKELMKDSSMLSTFSCILWRELWGTL